MMLRWNSRSRRCGFDMVVASQALLLLVAFSLFSPQLGNAQTQLSGFQPTLVRIPASATAEQREISRILAEGEGLEQDNKWAEAVRLYESGYRKYFTRELKAELENARLHFDVERRYEDPTFQRMLVGTSQRNAVGVLTEVLLKIESYHVEQPDWSVLAQHGTESLASGLSNESFQKFNLGNRQRVSQLDLRQYITARYQPESIRTRRQFQTFVNDLSIDLDQRFAIRPSATVFEFACTALSTLDWYSSFLTAEQYDEVISQIDGNFVGLGIEIQTFDDRIDVVNVIANGPAGEAGLAPGESIVSIDGVSVASIGGEAAGDRLRGPEFSWVRLTLETPQGRIRELKVRRRVVEIPSVEEARIVNEGNGVGYIRISSFQRTTLDEVQESLWQLHRDGMRSLIVDVRGNPGGLLDASVDVANLFLTQGTIVTTQGRNAQENRVRRADFPNTWQVPLVVLIDGNSASASEIFAGAIRDNRRGTILGERTYGKGSVQGIFPLNSNGGGIRLTTAKFYSPNGQAISQTGVSPDIAINPEDQVVALRPAYDQGEELSSRNSAADIAATNDEEKDVTLDAGIQQAIQLQFRVSQ